MFLKGNFVQRGNFVYFYSGRQTPCTKEVRIDAEISYKDN